MIIFVGFDGAASNDPDGSASCASTVWSTTAREIGCGVDLAWEFGSADLDDDDVWVGRRLAPSSSRYPERSRLRWQQSHGLRTAFT